MTVTRRRFLQGSAAAAGALGVIPGLRYVSQASEGRSSSPEVKYVNSSCAICTNKCVFRGQVVDGVIRRLEPEPDFPRARGMMCARGNAGAWTPYDPNRLKHPLIRTGKRGEGKWRKASWEEAYKHIADKINTAVEAEGGNRSTIGFISSEGTYQEHYYQGFRTVFGSPNILRHPTICLSSNIRGFMSVFGTYPNADIINSDYIILAGADRAESIFTPDTIDMFGKKGKTIICIDPRFTKTAAKSTKWFPINPGTDMAFALAMIHVILKENLQDQDFIDEYCTGFAELKEHVKDSTPAWAEQETGIPASEIERIAREFAKAKAPVFYPGRRSGWQKSEVHTRRSIAMVNAIVGNWDKEGGLVPNSSISIRRRPMRPVRYANAQPRLEADDVEFLNDGDGSWIPWRDRALKADPYRIRGLMIYKQNVVDSVPDRNKTFELFDKMDIIVCVDTFMSDTAWYADVVLPETNYLERQDPPFPLSGIEPSVIFRQPLIERMYDTKPGHDIFSELAAYFEDENGRSLGNHFRGTIEDHMNTEVSARELEQLKTKGFYTTGEGPVIGRTRRGELGINTPTGKVELYSEDFAGRGLDPLPVYKRPEKPGSGKFRFLVGRHAIHTHSMTAAFPELNWHMPENAIWINTKRANELGVKSGDMVKVTNRTGGSDTIKAQATEAIHPDCVYFAQGYGSLSKDKPLVYGRGAAQSAVLESHFEPISGNALMHETIVEIRKV